MVGRRVVAVCMLPLVLGACDEGEGDEKDDGDEDVSDVCGPDGVWVSALTGADRNPGTRDLPVRTITRGISHARRCGGPVHVGQGEYTEHVEIVEGISLLGGYDCASTPCSTTRSPTEHVAVIRNADNRGIFVPPDVTRATTIDGFSIIGSLAVDRTHEQFRTDAIAVYGSPTIANNVIEGAHSDGTVAVPAMPTTAMVIGASGDPMIADNRIIVGGGYQTTHYGIEALESTTAGEIRGNRIEVPAAHGAAGIVAGQSIVVDNHITLWSDGTGIIARGAVTIDRNTIVVRNKPRVGAAVSVTGSGAVITNNVMTGIGIEVVNQGGTRPLVINSNLIDAPTAVSLRSLSGPLVMGRIRNNIMLLRGEARAAIFEAGGPDGAPTTPEVVENNVIWYAETPPDQRDRLWRRLDGGTLSELTTIEEVNAVVVAAGNQLANPMLEGFRLLPGSPCIDAGTAADAPAFDIDGDARPQGNGYDIGPDELVN